MEVFPARELGCRGSNTSLEVDRAGSVAAGVAELGEDEVPAVAAVLAAVADDVTGVPRTALGRLGEQEAAPAAVDAHDLGFGRKFAHEP